MKKRYLIAAAGMALSLGVVTGCAGKGAEAPAETAQSTVAEETEISEEATEDESEEETEGEIVAGQLTHIWGEIESVEDGRITVNNQSENSYEGEIIFNIDPENTKILDAVDGLPVALEDIELGTFEAYLGPAMTMSIPPQTTPEVIIVNMPEDVDAPLYVTAAGAVEEAEDGFTLTTIEGDDYVLAEDVQVLPYLTRNIVTAEDVKEDSNCLIWLNEEDKVEKMVLFAE